MSEYIPYGPEWKKEISKLRKEVIVDMLAKKGIEVADLRLKANALAEALKQLIDASFVNGLIVPDSAVEALKSFEEGKPLPTAPQEGETGK